MRVECLEFAKRKMLIPRQTLENLLLTSVLDVRFVRRMQSPNKAPTRRMICTKSYELLNSTNGKIVLNYRPPTHVKKVNEAKENLCVVWDILMQDYRTVSADQVTVVKEIPANDEFWDYFNKEIYPLSMEQKIQFMDS